MSVQRIPWPQIKDAVKGIKNVTQLYKQVERNIFPAETVETHIVNPMVQVHSMLTKILRDNKILPAEAQEE